MWTTEQIIALAPDSSSEKNGRNLANAEKWKTLGKNDISLWGECQGSGKNPYQTVIDLREPAFKCSCPSRKFPCKHALGLFLLFAVRQELFKSEAPPAFCADWLEKRDIQKGKKAAQTEAELTVEEIEKREKSKARRSKEREKKVEEGLVELKLWLKDLLRQGLANAKNQSASYWEKTAKRMIDAQAAGAARMVREMASAITKTDAWAEEFLEKAGKIFLLIEAYKNLDHLPANVRADVRTAIGWNLKEDELEKAEEISDKWLVIGVRNYEEDKLRVQRTWLIGENSKRFAMLLDFAFQNQALKTNFLVGTKFEAELKFYPSNFPLRATVKTRGLGLEQFNEVAGIKDFDELLDIYSGAISQNPWLEVFPAFLEGVIPLIIENKCFFRDKKANLLLLEKNLDRQWKLIAFSGGFAINIFGEWNGKSLLPLRAFNEAGMIVL